MQINLPCLSILAGFKRDFEYSVPFRNKMANCQIFNP